MVTFLSNNKTFPIWRSKNLLTIFTDLKKKKTRERDRERGRERERVYQILLGHINEVIFLIVFLTGIVSEILVFSQTLLCINTLVFHLLLYFWHCIVLWNGYLLKVSLSRWGSVFCLRGVLDQSRSETRNPSPMLVKWEIPWWYGEYQIWSDKIVISGS